MLGLSELDGKRFGIRVAKATLDAQSQWREALAFCERESVDLLIARIGAADLALAQRMQFDGAFLTDVLLYFRLSPLRSGAAGAVRVRPIQVNEANAVKDLAGRCFSGYAGHYHADPRLDRGACDEVYADWAYRACSDRAVADEVIVAEENGRLLGFAALRLVSPREADGALFGVAPEARGRGVYASLLAEFVSWSEHRGASAATYSTQLANFAAQKAVVRAGFEPESARLTFHRWRKR